MKHLLRQVYVQDDEIATKGDVLQLLARLPYTEMEDLAAYLEVDVFHLAEGTRKYLAEREASHGVPASVEALIK